MKIQKKDIDVLFERGTIAKVYPTKEALEKHLLSGRSFHIYFGIDPTSNKIHLGHIQNILLLEDLRKLGVRVTLLFGSFTGLIGDPSERDAVRNKITRKEVFKNLYSWKKQISPVLKLSFFSGAKINYNNKWFDLFTLEDFLTMASETTVQQLLERDMFQKRISEGKPLYTHEMMYPILQGYDSVAMHVDGELCGTDQTFNALVGRDMVRRYLSKEKFVIAMNFIEGDGVLMSKSNGTGVFVDIEKGGSKRMFGSIMALPDSFILPLYRGCTRIPMKEINLLDINGVGARDAKLRLSFEIVKMFWGERCAKNASDSYITQFQKKDIPEDSTVIKISRPVLLYDIVLENASSSRSDAKRKFSQGAVSIDGEKIKDISYILEEDKEYVLRVGRNIFILR